MEVVEQPFSGGVTNAPWCTSSASVRASLRTRALSSRRGKTLNAARRGRGSTVKRAASAGALFQPLHAEQLIPQRLLGAGHRLLQQPNSSLTSEPSDVLLIITCLGPSGQPIRDVGSDSRQAQVYLPHILPGEEGENSRVISPCSPVLPIIRSRVGMMGGKGSEGAYVWRNPIYRIAPESTRSTTSRRISSAENPAKSLTNRIALA